MTERAPEILRRSRLLPIGATAGVVIREPWKLVRRWPVIPAIIITGLVVAGVFAPWIMPHDPYIGSLRESFTPPVWAEGGSSRFILGTDQNGRDILSRIMQGSRITLTAVAIAVTAGLLVGSSLGILAGYLGGWWDEIIMRLVDIWYAVPYLMIALVVVILFGQSLNLIMLLLAIFSWVAFVRVVRANTLTVKSADYIALARVAGASHLRIITKHILPMVLNSAMVMASLVVAQLILLEGTLSFIGAGIPAPYPAWGSMISEGRNYVHSAWWVSFWPGVAMFLVVMSFQFLGDWLRDRLDPRLRQIS